MESVSTMGVEETLKGRNQKQVKKRQPNIISLTCNISGTLTPITCTRVVEEIAKYIVCHKLIPYSYDVLKYLAQQSVETPVLAGKKKILQSRQYHKKITDAYENFENIFKNIELELQSCATSGDVVEEVVLLLGATIWSPKEIYRIKLSPVVCKDPVHKEEERILLHLIRNIALSEDFNDMLSHMLSPTNMYVMLKKKKGKSSEWLMPRDSYDLPNCKRQAVIDLTNLTENRVNCKDNEVMSISEQSKSNSVQSDVTLCQEPLSQIMSSLNILPSSSLWFQSPILFKGFRLPR